MIMRWTVSLPQRQQRRIRPLLLGRNCIVFTAVTLPLGVRLGLQSILAVLRITETWLDCHLVERAGSITVDVLLLKERCKTQREW